MHCPNCGDDQARLRYQNEVYGPNDDLMIITGVPVIACRACGQDFYDAATLHAIEAMVQHRARFATKRLIDVAPFVEDAEQQVEARHDRLHAP
jgi:YgiT-type zinc finger domain-containing protein